MVFSGHQPNFLPYMGYFYKMFRSDVFVLDDDVQYSRGEYQNSNYLKIDGEKRKMTVPVSYDYGDAINQVRICNTQNWKRKLLKTVEASYKHATYRQDGIEFLRRHLNEPYEYLADMNIAMIKEIALRFELKCRIVIASKDVPTDLQKNERNVYQCVRLGCNEYYSGIGGKEYNDEAMYLMNGVKLTYTDYKPVRYRQTGNIFIPNLSVLDYILNEGFRIPQEWMEEAADEK